MTRSVSPSPQTNNGPEVYEACCGGACVALLLCRNFSGIHSMRCVSPCPSKLSMAIAIIWQTFCQTLRFHGKRMASLGVYQAIAWGPTCQTWQIHGKRMANTRPPHGSRFAKRGKYIANAWQTSGHSRACHGRRFAQSGKSMANAWEIHKIDRDLFCFWKVRRGRA